jgi:hypothetical protein
MIAWFDANNLVVNLDKMDILKIHNKESHSALHIGYKEK